MTGRGPDSDLQQSLAALPREIAPRRDPWPRIARRIAASPGRRAGIAGGTGRWLLAAASVAIAVVGVVALREPDPNDIGPPSAHQDHAVRAPGYASALQGTEKEYAAAIQEFQALTRGVMPPETNVGNFAYQDWAVMVEAENELEKALRGNPDDPYINERLVRLRARQVDMLRQMASAGIASRRQTI